MEEICKQHLKDFKKENSNEVFGHLKSKEDYDAFINDLASNGFSFSTRSSESYSNYARPIIVKNGVPYTNIRRMELHCSLGKLYYELNRPKRKKDHVVKRRKRRILQQNTKKIGCQSKICVKMRRVFFEYISDPSSLKDLKKRKIVKELKERISENCLNIKVETWYTIHAFTEHNHDASNEEGVIQAINEDCNTTNDTVVILELCEVQEPPATCEPQNCLALLREDLKCMIDMTYSLEDGEYLDDILKRVKSLKEEFVRYQKQEDKDPPCSNEKVDHNYSKKRKRYKQTILNNDLTSDMSLPKAAPKTVKKSKNIVVDETPGFMY